ncbi:hypothetical protein BH23GEM6_BH23GEM6_21360 [soil metagenome]
MLSNLVGNALKFTPEGGQVEIGCTSMEQELRFVVSDTGAGIPPDQIQHIFGRFWQAKDRDTRGIGLGLPIVRGIVEAHGGRVWVESEVGQGARFYFTVPMAGGGDGVGEEKSDGLDGIEAWHLDPADLQRHATANL